MYIVVLYQLILPSLPFSAKQEKRTPAARKFITYAYEAIQSEAKGAAAWSFHR
jgi:hypothetical protein